ncbi:MAG: hypothetical protein M1817_001177 [Caeruleum heppii]|nr:MAG: hypothetical protein M1817_001177 [Caeruleum heppii]
MEENVPLPPTSDAADTSRTSIWQRSKDSGVRQFTFLQHLVKPSNKDKAVGGADSPTSAPTSANTTPASRRRQQVREAQRNHRQRKEHYVRALEQEASHQRELEASIQQQTKEIQLENDIIRQILINNGIAITARLEAQSALRAEVPQHPEIPHLATISLSQDRLGAQSLHVDMPDLPSNYLGWDQGPGFPDTAADPLNFLPDPKYSLPASSEPASFVTAPQAAPPSTNPLHTSHPEGLDSPQAGIDFVLALEQPCMSHIHTSPPLEQDPMSGHVFTASMSLRYHAPTEPYSTNSSYHMPSSEIQKLLDISSTLDLPGELTPVQAWNRIRQHPQFIQMSRQTFELLRHRLSLEVQCLGFGAVLVESVFTEILETFIAGTDDGTSMMLDSTIQA